MTSTANLTFRQRINAADDSGLCDADPAPLVWRSAIRHQRRVLDAYADYVAACADEASACSRLGPDERRDLEQAAEAVRAYVEDTFIALLRAAEDKAEDREDECDAEFFAARRTVSTPVSVGSFGGMNSVICRPKMDEVA